MRERERIVAYIPQNDFVEDAMKVESTEIIEDNVSSRRKSL